MCEQSPYESTIVNSKVKYWLDSGEYKTDIDTIRTNIMRKCAISPNESTTSWIFENELYFTIRAKTNIEIDVTREYSVNGVKHDFGILAQRTSGKGRLDAVLNNLIIEYKHHSKLNSKTQIETAMNQVVDYLNALYNNNNVKYNAILTDGLKICYFQFVGDKVHFSKPTQLSNDGIDTIVKAILTNQQKCFTAYNILKDFQINPIASTIAKDLAFSLYDCLKNRMTEKTMMLYEEWKSLVHLSVEDNGKSNDVDKRRRDLSLIFNDIIDDPEKEYRAIYALQTTYAIIVKLIACKVLDNIHYNSSAHSYYDLTQITSENMQSFFEKMEDGYSYRNDNIKNFLEGDFFSWYSDVNQWSISFWKTIQKIIIKIDEYSSFSFDIVYDPIDVFKDLYMSIIPKSVRHSMGEYFTPEWLADYVISESMELIDEKKPWRAIDPCCGTGIFIINIIKRIVGDRNPHEMTITEKNELLKDIINRAYGVDINPLSVLSARVGYYLALKPFGNLSNIDIPIYLGDSAIMPTKIDIDGISCFRYTVVNIKHPFDITLPERFVRSPEFNETMNNMQAYVKTDDPSIVLSAFVSEMDEKEKSSVTLMNLIERLSVDLTTLHKNNWDGIWVRILTNFMLIARLSNFDIIVGNPPWVKWEHLPAMYAKKIKELCYSKHLFSGAGQYGGVQLNICALISNVTATNWLTENGVLAFLMPDSIMSQNSYEGFRNFYIDYKNNKRLFIQKLDKWEAPLRPFRCDGAVVSQDFNTYYFTSNKIDYKIGFPVKCITRNKKIKDVDLNEKKTFDEVKQYLLFRQSYAKQINNKTTAFSYTSDQYDYSLIMGPTDYLYRTGVEFTPQDLYMLRGVGPSGIDGHYKFKSKEFKLLKYHVDDTPPDGWDFPTKYIYPIITGPNISPFKYDTNDEYCILPYDENNTKTPVSSQQLLAEEQNLFRYLINHKKLIDSQSERSKEMHRGDEFYSISKIGPYTYSEFLVAARDNSKFCASVIKKTMTPWGELKQTIGVKHTILISQHKDKTFITEDESYYICGILNSNIVRNYIMSAFKSNGYSLNKSNIFIPRYDPNNPIHTSISKISKQLSSEDSDIEESVNTITNLYMEICKNK